MSVCACACVCLQLVSIHEYIVATKEMLLD